MGKALFRGESIQHIFLYPDKVARNIGGLNFQQGHFTVIVHRGDETRMTYIEEGLYVFFLHGPSCRGVQQRHLQDIALFENLAGYAKVFRHEAAGGNASALAVAAVAHLDGRFVDVFAPQRDGTRETGYTTPALGFRRFLEPLPVWPQMSTRPIHDLSRM